MRVLHFGLAEVELIIAVPFRENILLGEKCSAKWIKADRPDVKLGVGIQVILTEEETEVSHVDEPGVKENDGFVYDREFCGLRECRHEVCVEPAFNNRLHIISVREHFWIEILSHNFPFDPDVVYMKGCLIKW